MKKTIDVYEHMGEILKGVKSGVLITGKADDKVNSNDYLMGNDWNRMGKTDFCYLYQRKPFHKKSH